MLDTKDIIASTGETVEYAKILVEQKVEYYQLEFAKRTAKTTANLITGAALSFLVMMILIFLSLALGLLLGKWWGSYALGFIVITGLYLFAAIVIFYFKKQIITNPVLSLIIKDLLD